MLNKKPFDPPTTVLFKKCKILNIYQTYQFKIIKRAHKQYYSDNISRHSHYSHFNLSLPPSTSAAGHRRTVSGSKTMEQPAYKSQSYIGSDRVWEGAEAPPTWVHQTVNRLWRTWPHHHFLGFLVHFCSNFFFNLSLVL